MYSIFRQKWISIKNPNHTKILRFLTTIDPEYQYIEKSNEKTDKYQASLPLQPIPNLSDTCKRYLDSVKPIIHDANQFENTKKIVKDFQSNIGQQLDDELKKRIENNLENNYFNENLIENHLTDRTPLFLNSNNYMILEDDPDSLINNPVLRATNILISLLRYRRSLNENVLKPETIEMSSFKNLFSTSRIPKENQDVIKYFGNDKKHVVFLHNGQFYQYDVIDQNDNIKSPDEIHNFISNIIKSKEIKNNSITSLCTLNRNKWAKVRNQLENLSEKNNKNFKIIDSAILVICLDEEIFSPLDLSSKSLGFLHGTYNNENLNQVNFLNRWFDKSIQLIISKNGDAGINFEKSWGDSDIISKVLNKVYSDSITNKFMSERKHIQKDISASKIDFDLNDSLNYEIKNAFEDYKNKISYIKMSVVNYEEMNFKYLLKKNINPDFIFQMAIQLACYKISAKTLPTIETFPNLKYKWGKTEFIRTATMETKTACNSMAWGEKKFTFGDLREALNIASRKHEELIDLAKSGQSCDRHLFSLKCLAKSLDLTPTPPIFTDPSYELANYFIYKTSNFYNDKVCFGGSGPVVNDGYNLSYGFTKNGMTLNCCSFENQDAYQFSQVFLESLKEINNVLERSTKITLE